MTKVEKKKATSPAMTELDSKVNSTLIPTLPHKIVVSRKLASSRNRATLTAFWFCLADSISRRSLLMLKKARFNPENMADWVTQNPDADPDQCIHGKYPPVPKTQAHPLHPEPGRGYRTAGRVLF